MKATPPIVRARSSRLPPLPLPPPVAVKPASQSAPAYPDWDAGRVISWEACGASGSLVYMDSTIKARTAKQAREAFLASNPGYTFHYASPRSKAEGWSLGWPGAEVHDILKKLKP